MSKHRKQYGLPFKLGIGLNTLYIVFELTFGTLFGSVALMTDAMHNLSDVLGLIVSWLAGIISFKKRTPKMTYGYKQATVLGAFANAVFVLAAMIWIIIEAIANLGTSGTKQGLGVAAIALLGVLVNFATAFLFQKDSKKDLNIKGAFVHMAADGMVSLGVVISGILISLTGWGRIDSLTSIIVAVIVIYSSWGLLRQSLQLLMSAVPDDVDVEEIVQVIQSFGAIENYHDLHVWGIGTNDVAVSVHISLKRNVNSAKVLELLTNRLKGLNKVTHTVIQIDCPQAEVENDY
ncbi:cobalt-zinc-cadmium resistance protein CzcD [Liquorilactobacillus sucicola DSM 21376 = JCM 15457]|uniref:Cation efflux protein n=1 Tax=Liquorilactobacillus sucicola DSM 21376 = JCM 15457 TaxID=1423806 RepID=A0A023CWR7_9LACO|nr:cation diffusion facilitator family transporter [Liquorilactobacillus sucicola]KRN06105.1 cation efflux protein [Liquorilactobacillus sucicola DSM 21376 = JCM 15457]GAJ26031.1 cobalt-zinc-cadmium resistance protein CzcD [Liquorilactobacillus sucicola DSM 21376 = JCM 15457]